MLAGLAPNAHLPQPLPREATRAFEQLKAAVIAAPVLRMFDEQRPIVIFTDASDTAIGAVLHQVFDDSEAPVAYTSKKLSAAEKNYSVRDRELLAVVYALKHWRHYLMGRKFTVKTDHESLTFLDTMDIAAGGKEKRLARWLEFLQDFEFDVKYVKGEQNVADALSRQETSAEDAHGDVMTSGVSVTERTDAGATRNNHGGVSACSGTGHRRLRSRCVKTHTSGRWWRC